MGLDTPVPASATWSGDDAAFVERLKVALLAPAPVGVKVNE